MSAPSIGSAFMRPDGTIELWLRADDGHGRVGDARFVYQPKDARYAEILDHLAGLKPGETKLVPPWPGPTT